MATVVNRFTIGFFTGDRQEASFAAASMDKKNLAASSTLPRLARWLVHELYWNGDPPVVFPPGDGPG